MPCNQGIEMPFRALTVFAAVLVIGLSVGCEGLFTNLEDIPQPTDTSDPEQNDSPGNPNDDPDDNETTVNQSDNECTEHAECLTEDAICHNNQCTETKPCDSDEQCSENFPRCEKDIGICFPGDDEEPVENDADGGCTSSEDCPDEEPICYEGECFEAESCEDDGECEAGLYCHEDGICVPEED